MSSVFNICGGENNSFTPAPRKIVPQGTLEITENGEYDVTQYAEALVAVAGGGDTPVVTRTVEGTLQNPFGDIGYTFVRDALKYNVGSALLTVTMNGSTATVPLFVQNNAIILNGTITTRSSGTITGFQTYIAAWLGMSISEFRLINGSDGGYVADDYTALAKNMPTTLTFTYWGG